jgi:hypothetical protein
MSVGETSQSSDTTPRRRRAKEPLENDSRFTQAATLETCRKLADVEVFTLDVAACEASHVAGAWFSPEVVQRPELIHRGCFGRDGLTADWVGAVWCNPPWSDCGAWVLRAWNEMARAKGPSVVAMLLPDNRREQPWWQELVEPHRDGLLSRVYRCTLRTHTLPGRPRFGEPGDVTGANAGSPKHGCCLLVWRRLGR